MNDLPNILTAQDIAKYLRVGPKVVYELMNISPAHGGIPSFRVGRRGKRVEKADFLRWLAERKEALRNHGQPNGHLFQPKNH